MTAFATIVRAGAETTVQDAGRCKTRHLGVPQSGAADRLSFTLANAAAGNRWDAPALECATLGPELEFTKPAEFAIGGANMDAKLNGEAIGAYMLHRAAPGDTLALGAARHGLRSYIAVTRGVAGDVVFGSASTYTPAQLGGFSGRALQTGDVLGCADMQPAPAGDLPLSARPSFSSDVILRTTCGPEFSLFDEVRQKAFLSEPFVASRRGNRMGVELGGCAICPPDDFSMVSSPVFPGTVQCPPSGAPFLLLADAQTVGGYARIAQIIDADIHLAGQIRPGARIWFHRVSEDEARTITAQQTAFYSAFIPGFRFG